MDRSAWLKERRREAEERYTTVWAPEYGEKWGNYSNASHQQFIHKFLALLPGPSTLLDAACGAGRYIPMLAEKGHSIYGIDQSQGMLDKAQMRFPFAHLAKTGLQEMDYAEMFEGTICMDALEHVCPEDWPAILANFYRALKHHGLLYFTVELADEQEVEQAFREAQKMGLPVVYGEWPGNDDVYHYYPPIAQVREWLQQAGFALLEEGEGDGYHHFLSRKS